MDTENTSKLIQILIVIAGVILSGMSGWSLYKSEEKAIISEFRKDVNERAASLHREVAINFETLNSLAILFNGDTIPDFKQFSLEAKKILSRHKDIQALEWIPRVLHSERAVYESKQRQTFTTFGFTEQKEQGHMVSAEEREEYFPVYFVEPLVGNEEVFGFDLSSNPPRVKALEISRDTATPQATASITLVQRNDNKKGFMAFVPIYEGIPSTMDMRREHLKGFVSGVYQIGAIFASSALSDVPLGIELKLVDETLPSGNDILYTYQSRAGISADESITYRRELPEIWGRKWSLIGSPTLRYIADRRDMLPQTIFVSGIIFTLFIALYIHIISKRSVTIQKIVLEKTKALSETNKKLKVLSRIDGLTGVANRRHMDEYLDIEWRRAARSKSSISFILIDIDYFKLYNDNYGHLEGDEVVKRVAGKLKTMVNRPGDLLARYGGEEFALVLTETEDAELVANSCRKAIEELRVPHEFSKAADVITISVGFCTIIPQKGTDPSWVIDSADKALYKAKKAGRNRVDKFRVNYPSSISKIPRRE